MNFLFVMDPIEKIHPKKDTTYLMIRELLRRNYNPFYCLPEDLYYEDGLVKAHCKEIEALYPNEKFSESVIVNLKPASERALNQFTFVLMRKDPPIDMDYFSANYLLNLATDESRVINNPQALQYCNEKLYALNFFKEVCPETIVTSNYQKTREFADAVGGKIVIKPFYQAGGEGVFLMDLKDPNFQALFETVSQFGKRTVLLQRFLPEIQAGDKRLILFDGDPVASVVRIPSGGDFRSNIHVGGTCSQGEITPRDREICNYLKSRLQKDGLFFVGLDIIGQYVTEINFTSPTCFQEINFFNGYSSEKTMEAQFFDRLFQKYQIN